MYFANFFLDFSGYLIDLFAIANVALISVSSTSSSFDFLYDLIDGIYINIPKNDLTLINCFANGNTGHPSLLKYKPIKRPMPLPPPNRLINARCIKMQRMSKLNNNMISLGFNKAEGKMPFRSIENANKIIGRFLPVMRTVCPEIFF